MRTSNVRFWVKALPVISLLVAGTSVGFQYYKAKWVKAELKRDEAEIQRLAPKGVGTYDPDAYDKPVKKQ